MEASPIDCSSRDILSRPLLALLLFLMPAVAIVVAGNSYFSTGWRTLIWTVSLGIMGIACLVNAARCGRVHCYLTGPFFLAMAVLTLLYGLGIAQLGRHGWNLLGSAILVGAIALCCIPELLFGKYRKASRR